MSEHHEFAQARGCILCRDGRDPCNPLSPECEGTKEMDRMMGKFAQADQARESRDQEPFAGGYDRGGVYHRPKPYLSPAETEMVRAMEREQGTPLVPMGAWLEGTAIGLSAIELAAIENCLTAEAMGMATEEECVGALAMAGASVDLHPQGKVLGNDMVNLPAHYARFKVEPISFIVENGLNWFQGNIVKYASRAEHKHATPEEDISKIIRYAEMWKEYAKGNKDWWR